VVAGGGGERTRQSVTPPHSPQTGSGPALADVSLLAAWVWLSGLVALGTESADGLTVPSPSPGALDHLTKAVPSSPAGSGSFLLDRSLDK
jgi:hypothetical protein